MQSTEPRIPPLPEEEWNDETRALLASLRRDGLLFNIFATLVRHPTLFKRWLVFASHTLSMSTLDPREREIAILRTGWLCRAEYEWGHHVEIGRKVGITEEDLEHIKQGPDAPGLNPWEATLLRGVDELHANCSVSEGTWKALSERYNTQQVLDFLFTVGQYRLVSMVLNSTGIQLEEGFEGFSS